MNREGSSFALSSEHATVRSPAFHRQPSAIHVRDETFAQSAPLRAKRDATVMIALWLFIGAVAAYDCYLSIKFQETLRFQELNPIGRWLMDYDGGSVATFMGCKFLGTSIALGVLQLLYNYWRSVGLTVASVLAGLQGMLALYLTFG